MISLYANENFPMPVVLALRKLGIEVTTTSDVGKSDQAISDDDVLNFAIEHEMAVITLNRKDFIKLHRQNSNHFGIMVCTFNPNFEEQAEQIYEVIMRTDTLKNVLLRINRPA
jgi:tetraacyldisaccharide-1-P 4'-kinase